MPWLAVVLSAALLGGSSAQVANSSLGLILGKVSHGVKRGVPNVTCNAYYGVPYAEPPTGNLRFASPQPWSAQFPEPGFDATKPGRSCPQLAGTDGDEDCLNLNVFTPAASRPGSDHNVMIFIHGGAFVVGSGTSPLPPIPPNVADMYDGGALASKFGVVVVTINYRLGPLGFLTTVASDGTVSSNFGMEDQREAIKWVRAHAKAFGGSGEDLTVFGQSAGAISVLHHMVSPLSKGLFTRAISESGLPMAMTADF